MPMYNNYPVTYQSPYYQPLQLVNQPMNQQSQLMSQQQNSIIPQPQQPVQSNNIIWVTGEAGAKSYLVAPNTTVQLWDSESQTIYLKSADASGMPSMKTLEYTIKNDNPPLQATLVEEEYISREEFEDLKGEIKSLTKEIDRLKSNSKREDKSNGKSTI